MIASSPAPLKDEVSVQCQYVVYPPAGPEGIAYKKMMEEREISQDSEPQKSLK
jgi:hypothetical protein